jgi:hypothetical protein
LINSLTAYDLDSTFGHDLPFSIFYLLPRGVEARSVPVIVERAQNLEAGQDTRKALDTGKSRISVVEVLRVAGASLGVA